MEKRTLLEIINDVAVSCKFDTVNDIGETVESEDIARIARNEYSKLMDRLDWPHLHTVTQLDGLGDSSRPNFMKVPSSVARVDEIRYEVTDSGDSNDSFRDITIYEDPRDFLDLLYTRNTGDDDITIYNTNEGIPVWVRTDKHPDYCTSFDDNIIVFDSYNSDVDSTLQSSKSVIVGLKADTWTENKDFVPDIPINMFSMFISKVKVAANEQLRQVSLNSEFRDHQILLNRLGRHKRVNQKPKKRNYGRK